MAQVQACDCRKAKEKAALLYVCRQQPSVSQVSICCAAVKGRLHTTTLSGCGCDSDPLLTTTRIFFHIYIRCSCSSRVDLTQIIIPDPIDAFRGVEKTKI